MHNPAYLTLSRHNVYYFRFPLPPALHPQRKQTCIRLSLDTRCPREAIYFSRCLIYRAENAINNPAIWHMDYQDIQGRQDEYDVLIGGAGDDLVEGSGHAGGSGDYLYGGAGDDHLYGIDGAALAARQRGSTGSSKQVDQLVVDSCVLCDTREILFL